MKKQVGKVTLEERDEIKILFQRKNGLVELSKILTPDNNLLYEKLVNDMGETQAKFQNWWDRLAQKYKWERSSDGNWEIDFDTCNIYLIN